MAADVSGADVGPEVGPEVAADEPPGVNLIDFTAEFAADAFEELV